MRFQPSRNKAVLRPRLLEPWDATEVPSAESSGATPRPMGGTGPGMPTISLAGGAHARAATASSARPSGPSLKPASRSSGAQSRSPAGLSSGASSPLVMRPSIATSGRIGSEGAPSTFTSANPPSSAENATDTTTVAAAWPVNVTSQNDHQARRTAVALATSKETPSWGSSHTSTARPATS